VILNGALRTAARALVAAAAAGLVLLGALHVLGCGPGERPAPAAAAAWIAPLSAQQPSTAAPDGYTPTPHAGKGDSDYCCCATQAQAASRPCFPAHIPSSPAAAWPALDPDRSPFAAARPRRPHRPGSCALFVLHCVSRT
jgi:hypothetical protein